MILDGRTAVDKYYVTGTQLYPIEDIQVQPNGVDLRVDKIYQISGHAHLGEDSKMNYSDMQKSEAFNKEGFYELKPHLQYMVDFHETVSVPEGYCAIIYPRSSLLRVGSFITSALWDTGFQGQLGASIRTLNPISIAAGARLAQIVFNKAAFNGHRYDGRYQGATSQAVYIR